MDSPIAPFALNDTVAAQKLRVYEGFPVRSGVKRGRLNVLMGAWLACMRLAWPGWRNRYT